jgi:hypothetical protein
MENRDYPEYDSDDNFIGWGPRRTIDYNYNQYYGSSRALPALITSFLEAITPKEEPKKEESIAPPLVFLKPGEEVIKTTVKPRARWEDDPDDNYWFDTQEPDPEPIEPVKPVENWSKVIKTAPVSKPVTTTKPVVKAPPVVYNKHNKQAPKSKNQKKYNNYDEDDDEPFEFYDRKGQTVYKY